MSAVHAEETRELAPAVTVRGDVPTSDLDRFAHAHPAATGYHLSGWPGVIERAFGHETQHLAAVLHHLNRYAESLISKVAL